MKCKDNPNGCDSNYKANYICTRCGELYCKICADSQSFECCVDPKTIKKILPTMPKGKKK